MAACNTKAVITTDDALEVAKGNRDEIEKVLSYFNEAEEKEKALAARYLVTSMVGLHTLDGEGMDTIEAIYDYMKAKQEWTLEDSGMLDKGHRSLAGGLRKTMDLQSVKADYLIDNINRAYEDWKGWRWNSEVRFEEFCELLLPYRSGNEPVTEWREPYKDRFKFLVDSLRGIDNSVEAAKIVSRHIGPCHYNIQFPIPHRSAVRLLNNFVGSCREDCDFTLYSMRSLGIPVAVDMMLVSPEYGTDHRWNVVYDNHDKIYRMFDNYRYPPTRDSLHYDKRRKGKVYRYTLAPDFDRLAKYSHGSKVPSSLTNPRIKDVTAEYFGHNKAEVPINPTDKEIYLGIFTPGGIKPIDIAERSGDKALFTDIEPNLIYFPIIPNGTGYTPTGLPFMLTARGEVHQFSPSPSVTDTVILTRKYPRGFHLVERFASAVGTHIQASDTPHGPWRDLHVITESPSHSYYQIPLESPLTERYLRVFKGSGRNAEIGEIVASNDSLGLEPIKINTTSMAPDKYEKIVDGDLLSWTYLRSEAENMVLHIDSSKNIEYLFYIPHNDDNFVLPGQKYELLYFSKEGWMSLGQKISDGFSIEFKAPRNSVLLLRNLTKGREEQIFIYRDGRQLFNLDLYNCPRQ